jgi:hypothetical protein
MHQHYLFRTAQVYRRPASQDDQDAGPQRMGMASTNLRRKRAPVITSAACAAQYFVESISQTMCAMIPVYLRDHSKPQPKFEKSPRVISRQATAILL